MLGPRLLRSQRSTDSKDLLVQHLVEPRATPLMSRHLAPLETLFLQQDLIHQRPLRTSDWPRSALFSETTPG